MVSVLARIAEEGRANIQRGSWTPREPFARPVKFKKVTLTVLGARLTFTEWETKVSVELSFSNGQVTTKLKVRKEEFSQALSAWKKWASEVALAMDSLPQAPIPCIDLNDLDEDDYYESSWDSMEPAWYGGY